MASEKSENAEPQEILSPVSPSERPEDRDNVSSDGPADNATTVGRAPMAPWRLTLVLAWYEEVFPSQSTNDYKKYL